MAFQEYNPQTGSFSQGSSNFQAYDPKTGTFQSNGTTHKTSAITAGLSLTGKLMSNLAGAGVNFTEGAAKSAVDTGMRVGKLISEEGQNIPGPVGEYFKGRLNDPRTQKIEQELKSDGAAQTAGHVIEKTAEFFAPGGGEKAVVTEGAEYIDKIPEALGLTGKAATAVTTALKTALSGVVSGTSAGAVTEAQTGGDQGQSKTNAAIGAVGGALSEALDVVSPGIKQWLNKSGFKLSPALEAKATKVADSASEFLSTHNINGYDSAKFKKVSNISSDFESAIQGMVKKAGSDTATAAGSIAVPKADIVDSINTSVESLRSSNPAIYSQARSQANKAIKLIQEQKGDAAFTKGGTISVEDALNGKRSYGEAAFKTSQKGKISDPTVTAEGQFAVEQAYQSALSKTLENTNTKIDLPESMQKYFDGAKDVALSDFNKVYSQVINAKKLLFAAQFKNDVGLFGRLFGLAVGEVGGQAVMPGPVGKMVGMTAGEIASNTLAPTGRNLLERLLSHPDAPGAAAKVTTGVSDAQETNSQ